jgi:ArsR family transcriptional regulator, nickel/cobalt-responsive transcriptional repressor
MSLDVAADHCADVLRVLADDTRLRVVRLLLSGPRHVGQLNEVLQIDQSLLSHHLRVMREAGLIVSQRDGKAVRYQLAPVLVARRKGQLIDLGCCRLSFD